MHHAMGWAAFLFTFHLFCELIPMNMVFIFQIATNLKRLEVKKMLQSVCGEDTPQCPLKVPKSNGELSGGEDQSTCDEVNTYYDENEEGCGKKINAFDKFVENRRRIAAGTGGLMGESQSEVESEYRVQGKKKRTEEEAAVKTGFGTGTIVEY
jgi:hypothetical protein